jgi:phosphoglycerate dehydrogenase-like enzyme
MRLAILDDYLNSALDLADWSPLDGKAEIDVFTTHIGDQAAIIEALSPYDALVVMRERTKFPAEVLSQLPKLKLLVSTGMSSRHIDLDAATSHGVTVCGTTGVPGANNEVELCWGMIIGLFRNLVEEDRMVKEGGWQTRAGIGVAGKTLGILGLGRLGSGMAVMGNAFGMDVIAWSENLTAERCAEFDVTLVDKNQLFERSDVVSIHLIESDRTRGMVGAADLARMKKSAYLINTSRGPIVDEKALVAALEGGSIAGAGLDVYDVEPLPLDHPLRRAPNTMLTAHIGYGTDQTLAGWYQCAVENVTAYLGGAPERVLNKDILAASKP